MLINFNGIGFGLVCVFGVNFLKWYYCLWDKEFVILLFKLNMCFVLNIILFIISLKIKCFINFIIFFDLEDWVLMIFISERLFIWNWIFLCCNLIFYNFIVNIIGMSFKKVMFYKMFWLF